MSSEQNYPHQILLNGGLYDCFKLLYAYWNEGEKICECYSCLKMVIQVHFSLNVHHLNDSIYIWNCYNQTQFLKQKNNHEVFCDWNFCMKLFASPSSKNIIVSLPIVIIEISELDIPSYIIFSSFIICFKPFQSFESMYPKCHFVFLINWKTKFKLLWLDFVFTSIWKTKFK